MENLKNEITYNSVLEKQNITDEKKPRKKNKKFDSKKTKEVLIDNEDKKDFFIKLRAVKNFMLWDKTMVREGEVVEVPKPYAERLLTHTPQAFIRA
jgi:hypothetical protein